jgi:hypothetical protein
MGDTAEFVAFDDANPHWKVAVAFSEVPAVHGFVNCAAATGAHVSYVERVLYGELVKALDTKRDYKALNIKAATLKNRVTLFIVATVSQPTFSSQIKDNCVSFAKRLSDYVPSEAFIKKVLASQIVSAAAEQEKSKVEKKLAKATDGKKTARVNIPKLVDAIHAGTSKSAACSLILTEGDSAKAFAVAGLSVVGRSARGVRRAPRRSLAPSLRRSRARKSALPPRCPRGAALPGGVPLRPAAAPRAPAAPPRPPSRARSLAGPLAGPAPRPARPAAAGSPRRRRGARSLHARTSAYYSDCRLAR